MPLDSYGAASTYDASDEEKVTRILQGFGEKRTRRSNFEVQWQEAALLGWPEYANTFFWGARPVPGAKKAQQQIDSSVSIASHRFAAIVNGLWTPSSSVWTRYYNPDDYVMRQNGVAQYYDDLTRLVWTERYRSAAGFRQANLTNMQSEGMFGNMNLYIDEADTRMTGRRGLRYTQVPVGDVWYEINHQGQVAGFYRAFRWTAKQIRQKWPDTFPPSLQGPLDQQSEERHEIVQYCGLRGDWSPYRIDAKGMRYMSCYVSVHGHCILEEKGYRSFPLATGRYMVAPDEDYGRGPGQMILASAKTKNAQKVVFLEQGHLAGKPIYLTTDGDFTFERYPGAVIAGGMAADGTPLARVLETGNIQITKEMMDEEGRIIDDAFLVTLFRLALDIEKAPNLSARQVVEMIEQRAIFLAPVSDGPHDEYLGSLVPRELDVLSYAGMLPPKPEALIEAQKGDRNIEDYEVEFTNPMTRAMQAGESAAAMQMVEAAAMIANSSQDSSVWRTFSFKRMMPGMARNRGMRPDWLATPQEIQQAERAAAQAADREQRAKEMPAQAAIMKAQAITAKAQTGGNIGGTLSGVPAEQMPGIPGNEPGMPGQPGVAGRPGMSGRGPMR